MRRRFVETNDLRIAVDEFGLASGRPVLLQHGWPDGPESFAKVAESLAWRGYRCILPTLRGHGETTLKPGAFRGAQVVALARDLEAVIDDLGLGPIHVVGHDWGCRAAFASAALFPDKLKSIVPMSLGWRPSGSSQAMSIPQCQAFWYQWWFATPVGAEALKARGADVARRMWDTWSPAGWFTEDDWRQTAPAFENPDWADVVLHFYRARHGLADLDPSRHADDSAFAAASRIGVPCCLIHGTADRCTLPELSEGTGEFVDARYERHMLDGIGHFSQREAPNAVADIIADWIDRVDQERAR
jgi:pimeloyl-ACP methyl ester carboxylesterase